MCVCVRVPPYIPMYLHASSAIRRFCLKAVQDVMLFCTDICKKKPI